MTFQNRRAEKYTEFLVLLFNGDTLQYFSVCTLKRFEYINNLFVIDLAPGIALNSPDTYISVNNSTKITNTDYA